MWDRLLVDCNIATMDPAVAAPFGAIENGAIGIQDGRIVRVGRRTELAGYQAKKVETLGRRLGDARAWSIATPISSSPATGPANLSSGSKARPMRRSRAAGGGIASTVKATRAASLDELVEASRPRLQALMAGGVTTVEIKSGYGLDIETELKMLRAAKALGESETVRSSAPCSRSTRCRPNFASGARNMSGWRSRRCCPRPRSRGWRRAVDAFCEGIGFTRDEVRALFEAARDHGLEIKLHAEQLSNLNGAALAARLWRAFGRPSRTCRRGRRGGDGARRAWSRCCCPAPFMR